ncbi:unnamed protein product [Paramecium pentaurelia]|uniref:Uncharacterized protein n=1 Tax=Paramecium pentaurelia TaxID=43138 RepID=A0A8S1VXS8_9CILI|nr:unnamed protein product [Paramecium pentaurelia]
MIIFSLLLQQALLQDLLDHVYNILQKNNRQQLRCLPFQMEQRQLIFRQYERKYDIILGLTSSGFSPKNQGYLIQLTLKIFHTIYKIYSDNKQRMHQNQIYLQKHNYPKKKLTNKENKEFKDSLDPKVLKFQMDNKKGLHQQEQYQGILKSYYQMMQLANI